MRAGIIPLEPKVEYTKRWEYTSQQHQQDQAHRSDMTYQATFSKLRAEAIDYYVQVSLPHMNNWAELFFVWY